jgi:hypothetical protein
VLWASNAKILLADVLAGPTEPAGDQPPLDDRELAFVKLSVDR